MALVAVLAWASPGAAQVDPLLAVKRSAAGLAVDYRAHVLVVIDTSERMQWGYFARTDDVLEDRELRVTGADLENGVRWSRGYYDPHDYSCDGGSYLRALGLGGCAGGTRYRRLYVGLDAARTGTTEILAVSQQDTSAFARFYDRSRLGAARNAIAKAVRDNAATVRFGLLQTRHRLAAPPSAGSVLSARTDPDPARSQVLVTDDPSTGRWTIMRPPGEVDNAQIDLPAAPLVRADDGGANEAVIRLMELAPGEGGLVGAGNDTSSLEDSPLATLLADARLEAERLVAADTRCRNIVVLLVTGGGEQTGGHVPDAALTALAFRNVRGRRVPIHVIGIEPSSGGGDGAATDAELQAIADASGGSYTRVSAAGIELAAREGTPVPGIVRALNLGIQHALADPADVNAPPSAGVLGPKTDVQVGSPVVGTVDLNGARFFDGRAVPSSEARITTPTGVLPQRGNLLVSSGFSLPGFGAVLRGFRVYRPVADPSRPSGYAFVADGTKLWELRLPTTSDERRVDGSRRNVFTALADGTVIPFTEANWEPLREALRMPLAGSRDVQQVIYETRARPIGPIVSSMPAILDPPSLAAPNGEYVAFAEAHRQRRTLVFVGANDGMLHAVDARTGLEVWAFVPYNLLPKLNEIRNGLAIDHFVYTMDGPLTLADVEVGPAGNRRWRTFLVAGEGAGGTFYQAFDVTLDDVESCVGGDEDVPDGRLLDCFASPGRIPLAWAFPSYAHFDPGASTWGDLRSEATAVEKTVGQTWSGAVVGQVLGPDGAYAVLVGSGFFPRAAELSSGRGGTAAGTAFYLLDAADGSVSDWRDVGNDGRAETVDDCAAALPQGCTQLKNALQASPAATGPPGSRFITKAYLGDLDGNVWRFDLGMQGGRAVLGARPARLFAAGPDQPIVGAIAVVTVGTEQHLYFGGGSDRLPSPGERAPFRLYGLLEGHATPTFTHSLAHGSDGATDERLSGLPIVAGDIVFFGTTGLKPGRPCDRPDASLYAFTFVGGAAYDTTGDSRVSAGESPRVLFLPSAGRASAPYAADRHLWFGAGTSVSAFGDPRGFNRASEERGVRMLSWRQVR